MLLNEAKSNSLWKRIRTEEEYQPFREQLYKFYKENDGEMPVLNFRDFMTFSETGNRIYFEEKYFRRRAQLIAAVGMFLLEEQQEYLERLENVLWAICDEYTWSLPAHVPPQQESALTRRHIDLFAAETGFALSEISQLLEEKLHPRLLQRMNDEVDARILCSFEQTEYHWEYLEMNWSAVCAGSVGACFLYLAPERFPAVKQRILNAMNCFLRGFGTDGCCREGMSYWNYGFGFFTYFADLLYKFTNGKENLFANPLVEKVAQFPQIAFLNPSTVISFADCGPDADIEPGLISYLTQLYPEQIYFTGRAAELLDLNDRCYRWATFIRNIVWTDYRFLRTKAPEQMTYLPQAQWYVNHNGPFSFAAKGGHNDEPHNHNDLGGFILADEQEQLLCDLGSGLYTHAYFQSETRYDVISNSSLGHSVPMIDGTLQQPGENHFAQVVRADSNTFSVDITGAYLCDDLTQALRTFQIQANTIKLNDHFAFTQQVRPVTERFVTRILPRQEGCKVFLKGLCIESDVAPEITERQFTDHGGSELPFYTIDYHITQQVDFCLTFSKSNI